MAGHSSPMLQAQELSTAQKSMWLLNALDRDNTSYVITLAYDLEGQLNHGALEQSIEALLERHPVLKTYYPVEEGVPVKKVSTGLKINLALIDNSSKGFSEQELFDYVNRLANTVFDISKPPLIRFSLIKCSEQRHILVFSMHHIISDGWSLGLLLNDLSEAYNAYNSNRIPSFSVSPGTYEEYIQRYDFAGKDEAQQKKLSAYWQEYLEGYEVVNFPYDNPRLSTEQFKSKKYEACFDLNTTMALESLCRENSATLYMGLMAVFCFLLMRYTGQQDLTLGTPVCNRLSPEFENTIGLFVNSLVVRFKFQKNPDFLEALAVVKEVMLEGLEHQDMPFEKLVELLNPERIIGQNPVFQIIFALQNAYNNTLDFEGIQSTEILADTQLSRFDLESVFWRNPKGIKWRLVYNEHLIADYKCKAMVRHFENILKTIIESPTKPLHDIPYLNPDEAEYLNRISQGAIHVSEPVFCIHEFIEKNAALWRDKPAVKQWKNQFLTYQELNSQSSQLAKILLTKFPVTRQQIRIAVRMKPTVDLAIVLLAILKAGMIIIPLNYDDPEERVDAIIKSAKAEVVITDTPGNSSECLGYHSLKALLSEDYQQIILPKVSPNALAYIIFTSGTTGEPKGVMIEHKSLMNTLLACHRAFMFTESDVFACASVFAFDIFFFEFFAALIAGGSTYLIDKMELLDSDIISQIIPEITSMHLVPGVAQGLINLLHAKQIFASLPMRHFATGGDAVSNNLLIELGKLFPHAELSVLYGPTETAILASRYVVNSKVSTGNYPIGKPLDNTLILIADEAGNQQPLGIPGMLYIGGPGVARGYLNAPDLNQEKFVMIGQERYFKTGDLARWLPNGVIDFIGRADNQVKIRGHRIELGEVNAAIYSYPAIKDVVTVVDRAGNNKQIIAYVVLKKEYRQEEEIQKKLRSYLPLKLPNYMLPGTIILLDKLPLSKNGKIDKKALSIYSLHSSYQGPDPSKAFNAIERIVHKVFCQVLKLDDIGEDDSFFNRGGNSLLAIEVSIKLRKEKLLIKPQDLFRHQTIAELSKAIQNTPAVLQEQSISLKTVSSAKNDRVNYLNKKEIKTVLLLGSTGFLGAHLLNQLVNCKLKIYCLIRGNAEQTALMRLKESYQFYFPEEQVEQIINKIVILHGDISYSDFKLGEDEYRQLAKEVDTIINAAANVNHVAQKENITSVNIEGIKNLINLCKIGRAKTLHHISTVGIKGLYRQHKILFDETMLEVNQLHTEDYSQSKYDAELMIQDYVRQGGKANVYRVGTIGPHYQTGVFQKNIEQHFLSRYLNSTIQLGLAGNWQDKMLDLTPVDSLATAVLLLIFNSELLNKTFHLVSPDTISYSDLIGFLQNCGYSIRRLDAQAFKNQLFSLTDSEKMEKALTGIIQLVDSYDLPHNALNCDRTTRILAELGYEYPKLTSVYLAKFINFGIKANYFLKPRYWDELARYPTQTSISSNS